ncbi:MAG: diguanylate cyclase [Desulfosalsimonadaceae bacterium]|nr:diguanylate cyclase [Desulfosalsimonadaceae bacterium]
MYLVTGIVFICAHAHALEPTFLKDSPKVNICRTLEFLEDPAGELSLEELLHPGARDRFVPVNDPQLNLGITRSTYWFRFLLKFDPSGNSCEYEFMDNNSWLLEIDRAWMPTIELWVPVIRDSHDIRKTAQIMGENWRKLSAVTSDQSNRINLLNRSSIFFIPKDYDENRPMYLKMASWGPPLNFSLQVRRLNEFRNWLTWDFTVFGIIYGLIIAMTLYNACIYLSLRDKTYLVYVLYILTNFLYLSIGLGQFSALTGVLSGSYFYLIYVFSGSAVFFAAWFCRTFLMTSKNAPLIDKILMAYMFFAILLILMAVTGFYYQVQILSAAIGATFPIMAITAGLVCFIKGMKPAGYFLTAWSVLSVGILTWAFRSLGILPQTQLITYSYPVAVAAESILLSLALADRIRTLQQENRHLENRERRLLVLSNTDGLTKLYNKRYFNEKLKSEIALSGNLGDPLSLLILDLDDFKKVNDAYGHPAGDQVLKRLGEIVLMSIRDKDCGCRYGGEEFTIILPGTGKEKALDVAERIRRLINDDTFEAIDGQKFSATVSIGLAQFHPGENSADLINRADKSLYSAKRQGKNQTVS